MQKTFLMDEVTCWNQDSIKALLNLGHTGLLEALRSFFTELKLEANVLNPLCFSDKG
jgi:hypothetical protein